MIEDTDGFLDIAKDNDSNLEPPQALTSYDSPEQPPPADAEAETKATKQIPTDCLRIAVIGDVGTDWAFISSQPARSRSPVFQPWTKYPATHLYSFPGGAWFSGHMIQGAIADPIFQQVDSATTHAGAASNTTAKHIVLTADILPFATRPEGPEIQFTFDVPLSDAATPQQYAVILDDDTELDLPDYASSVQADSLILQISIAPTLPSLNSRARLQIGLLDSTLTFNRDQSSNPGRIVPDKVFRRYEAEDFSIPVPPKEQPQQLTFITLHKLDFRLSIPSMKEDSLLAKQRFSSIRIVPSALRHGDFAQVPPLKLFGEPPCTIDCAKGNMDVTYGTLELVTTTTDRGKFNPPHSSVVVSQGSTPLSVKLIADDKSDEKRVIPHVLWFYENPRSLLSMQHPGHVVHTLSELAHFKRHYDQHGPTKVYRRKLIHGIDGPRHGYPTVLNNYSNHEFKWTDWNDNNLEDTISSNWRSDGYRIVVIDDEGTGFSSRHQLWSPFLWSRSEQKLHGEEKDFYSCFQSHNTPDDTNDYLSSTFVIVKASHWVNPPRSTLISFIAEHDVRKRSVLVISAESLRGGLVNERESTPGIKLAKAVSWEQTLEDFEVALTDTRLQPLQKFSHILIRLGLDGALLWSNCEPDHTRGKVRLIFDPARIEGEYCESDDLGQFPGLTTVFSAAIVRKLSEILSVEKLQGLEPNQRDAAIEKVTSHFADSLPRAVEHGLQCCRRYFDLGYGPEPDTVRKFENLQLPISQIFGRDAIDACQSKGRHSFARFPSDAAQLQLRRSGDASNVRSILLSYLSVPSAGIRYIDDKLMDKEHDKPALIRAINAIHLGRTIVREGTVRAFKNAAFPFARFGRLLTTDRSEIEGLRSIRTILNEYIHHDELKVPLSIGVFGPPGSGKSFGVEQIAEGLAPDRIKKFVFNLAQFRSFDDVSRLLLEVRDAGIDDKLPLVFFDEFDSPFDTQPLGWLKYFLAPMQDGRFQHDDSTLGLGKAIFVFAGGIASTHADFRDEKYWEKQYGIPNLFKAAKGTDFHSRLRGFLNISGTNPDFVARRQTGGAIQTASTEKKDEYRGEDFAYVIRRALIVRQLIERLSNDSKAKLLDEDQHAEIDGDVLNALLLTEEYRHGVRSIGAVFQMSSLHGERVISKTSLPSSQQLAMHVDQSFTKILTRKHTQLGSRVLESALEMQAAEELHANNLQSRDDRTYYSRQKDVTSF